MTTKKKQYEKPSMEVFELKQQPQLLAGSNDGSGNVPGSGDYPDGGDNPFGF